MTMETDTLILDSYARLCAAHAGSRDGPFAMAFWSQLEELGLGALLTDYAGEIEQPERTAAAVARLTGYHCVPLPVMENMLARALLHKARIEVPAGLLAFGVVQQGAAEGDQALVPWARHASHLVLAARTPEGEQVLLMPANGPGVTISHRDNLAGEPRDLVRFALPHCTARAPLAGAVEWASLEATRYRAALMVGAAESALDLTVAYVNERSQFGKPLGKFQAVQQSLAVFAGEVTSALSACALSFGRGEPDWRTVAIAKMRADVAASVGCNTAHQAHGAIGVTSEYPLHLRTQRLWSWRTENGSGAAWARRLGEDFIAAGAANLWPALTALR